MNERIRELGLAAAEGSSWKPGLGNPQVQEYMEKFAKLIIKECANVAADHEALDIYEEIREHFGVEE